MNTKLDPETGSPEEAATIPDPSQHLSPDARDVIRRFQKRARRGLRDAVAELRVDPTNADAAHRAAQIYLQCGAHSAAAKIIADCLAAGGARPFLYREGGWIFYEAGLYRQAVKSFARAMATGGEADTSNPFLGLTWAINGLVRDAADGLMHDDRSRYVAGIEHMVTGAPIKAEPILRELAVERPRFREAWAGWRGALEALGQTAEASAIGAEWVRAAPDLAPVIATVMARRFSARGLLFDPREPIPIRGAGQNFAEVREPSSLNSGEDKIVFLERGGQKVELEPVIPLSTVGEQQTQFSYQRADKFVASIDGGALVGRGLILNRAGEFPEETSPPCSLKKAGFASVGQSIITDPRAFRDGACPIRIFDAPALLMACPTDSSFGDWILNVPDRLAIAAKVGLDCPLVLREGTPKRFIEILGSLGWDTRRIVYHDPRGVSLFPRLYTTSWPLHRWNTPMSELLGIYRTAPGRRRLAVGAGERIYLSREGAAKRPLINESEIRKVFESRGFRAVRPEALDLQETKDLFANADVVAGPYGSAFLNVVHAPRPPTALVLMPPDPKRFLHEVALWLGSSGTRFGYLFGDPVPGRDKVDPWTAPVEKVEAAIDELLEVTGPT